MWRETSVLVLPQRGCQTRYDRNNGMSVWATRIIFRAVWNIFRTDSRHPVPNCVSIRPRPTEHGAERTTTCAFPEYTKTLGMKKQATTSAETCDSEKTRETRRRRLAQAQGKTGRSNLAGRSRTNLEIGFYSQIGHGRLL